MRKTARRAYAWFMNGVVNPFLVRTGRSGSGRSELGTVEHFGRKTGTRRLTPVRPHAIEGGFSIGVPLGVGSHWVRNVLAAGHCRMQLRDVIYDLDEPALLLPSEMAELAATRRVGRAFGSLRYLRLRTFAQHSGSLEEERTSAKQAFSESAEIAAVPTGAVEKVEREQAPSRTTVRTAERQGPRPR